MSTPLMSTSNDATVPLLEAHPLTRGAYLPLPPPPSIGAGDTKERHDKADSDKADFDPDDEFSGTVETPYGTDYFASLGFGKTPLFEQEITPHIISHSPHAHAHVAGDIEQDIDEILLSNQVHFSEEELELIRYPIFYISIGFDGKLAAEQKKIKEELDDLLSRQQHYPAYTPLLIQDKNRVVWVYGRAKSKAVTETTLKTLSDNATQGPYSLLRFARTMQVLSLGSEYKVQKDAIYRDIAQKEITPFFEIFDPEGRMHIEMGEGESVIAGLTALVDKIPAVNGPLGNYEFPEAIGQYLRLFPDNRPDAIPYVVLVGIVMGTVSTIASIYGLRRPNGFWLKDRQSGMLRAWWSLRDALIVDNAFTGMAIAIDLAINPSHAHNASTPDVWIKYSFFIVLPPLVASSFVLVWRTLSPLTKSNIFKQQNRFLTPLCEHMLDNMTELFINFSAFSIFLKNTCNLSLNPSLIGGAVTSIATVGTTLALSLNKSPYSKLPSVLVLYFFGTSAAVGIYKELNKPESKEEVTNWSLYYYLLVAQSAIMTIQILPVSIFFVRKYFRQFIKYYQQVNQEGARDLKIKADESAIDKMTAVKRRFERIEKLKDIVRNHELFCWPQSFMDSLDVNSRLPSSCKQKNAIILSKDKEQWYAYFIRDSKYVVEKDISKNDFLKKVKLEKSIEFIFNQEPETPTIAINTLKFLINEAGRVTISKYNYRVIATLMEEALDKAGLNGSIPLDMQRASHLPSRAARGSVSLLRVTTVDTGVGASAGIRFETGPGPAAADLVIDRKGAAEHRQIDSTASNSSPMTPLRFTPESPAMPFLASGIGSDEGAELNPGLGDGSRVRKKPRCCSSIGTCNIL